MYAIYYELKLLDNIKMINTGKKSMLIFFNISKYINICRVENRYEDNYFSVVQYAMCIVLHEYHIYSPMKMTMLLHVLIIKFKLLLPLMKIIFISLFRSLLLLLLLLLLNKYKVHITLTRVRRMN